MTGEKAETRELKETLAEYFRKKDIEGAKEYFLKRKTERPDVMMEASDVSGELRICMQIIATAGKEMEVYGHSILDKVSEYHELIEIFTRLNQIVTLQKQSQQEKMHGDEQLRTFIEKNHISDVALKVAEKIYESVRT
jgi:hypothetical protein